MEETILLCPRCRLADGHDSKLLREESSTWVGEGDRTRRESSCYSEPDEAKAQVFCNVWRLVSCFSW